MSMTEKPEGPTDWGPTRTKQSAEAESNINNIVKLYTKTGQLTHISQHLANYRDMSGIPDLHEAMNIVADANSTFQDLPAEVRKAMRHDVANFLPFIDDPENLEQCVEWGILPAPTKAEPNPGPIPPVVPDPPADPPADPPVAT